MVEPQRPTLKIGKYLSLILFSLGAIAPSHSYVLTESTLRVPIRWSSSSLQINVDTSANDFDPSKNIFCRHLSPSLQATCTARASTDINEVLFLWNQASPVGITSNPYSSNRLSFSADPRFFSPGVVAVTLLSYNPGDGIIKNGQIYVNQQTNPGFCFTQSKSAMGCVYLGDVIAHELGHFAGLAHSEVRESTMLFTSFRGQHALHQDDVSGLRSIYQATTFGKIRGRVLGGNRVPVFGAHVQAISLKTGNVAASALTQENGSFAIDGLDVEQTYYLYTEPLRKLDSLPDAFRSAKNTFCPGSYVGSFFETCASQTRGQPQAVRLTSSQSDLDVGVVSIRCQVRVSPSYLDAKLRTGSGVYEFSSQPSRPVSSFVGYYSSTEIISSSDPDEAREDLIKLDLSYLGDLPFGSTLVMKILSTAIGSPVDFSVNLSGPFGLLTDPDRPPINPNPGRDYPPPSTEPSTLRPLFQRQLSYPLSATGSQNLLDISLAPRALDAYEIMMTMPDSSTFTLKDRPYLVMFEIHRGNQVLYSDLGGRISDNSSCIDAPYTFAVKANNVSSAAMAGQQEEAGTSQVAGASCGTIEPPNSSGGSGPASFVLGLLLLVFLPKKIRSKKS